MVTCACIPKPGPDSNDTNAAIQMLPYPSVSYMEAVDN